MDQKMFLNDRKNSTKHGVLQSLTNQNHKETKSEARRKTQNGRQKKRDLSRQLQRLRQMSHWPNEGTAQISHKEF